MADTHNGIGIFRELVKTAGCLLDGIQRVIGPTLHSILPVAVFAMDSLLTSKRGETSFASSAAAFWVAAETGIFKSLRAPIGRTLKPQGEN